jgi:NADH-quinone oxidoreductase subunit N
MIPTITSADMLALLPFFMALGFALIVTLLDAFHRSDQPRAYVAHIAVIGMLMTVGSVWWVSGDMTARAAFGGLIYHDRFSSFLNILFASAAATAIALSPRYLRSHLSERGEYYALIMLAVTGMMLMGSSGDLVMIFLGIEVMSICVYVLVGFFRSSERSAEGAMKYFFLGAFASGIFLYGVALVYGTTGSTKLTAVADAIRLSMTSGDGVLVRAALNDLNLASQTLDPLLVIGMLLIIAGMAFKIALVPFHMWTPDAYDGAPSSSVGFMATAVKAAGFGALIRILFIGFEPAAARLYAFGWVQVLFYLAIITIVVGNLVALTQSSVKRMLAYSSIAHAGYALIGVTSAGYISGQGAGNASVLFYLLTYTFTTLGAFGVLTYLSRREQEVESFDDLAGLGHRYPAMGAMLTIFMLSSAGIPPTAGFVGKFHVFQMAMTAGASQDNRYFFWLVVIAALASLAGMYYYLRVVVALYMKPARRELTVERSPLAATTLAICAILTLWMGIYPKPFLDLSHRAVEDFAKRSTPAVVPGINTPPPSAAALPSP